MRRTISKLVMVFVLLIVSMLIDRPNEAVAGYCEPYWCCDSSCDCIRRCWPNLGYYGGCQCEDACICS